MQTIGNINDGYVVKIKDDETIFTSLGGEKRADEAIGMLLAAASLLNWGEDVILDMSRKNKITMKRILQSKTQAA